MKQQDVEEVTPWSSTLQVNRRSAAPNKDPNMNTVSGMGGGGYGNPLGRASVVGPVAPAGDCLMHDLSYQACHPVLACSAACQTRQRIPRDLGTVLQR